MQTLTQQILELVAGLPEGATISAKELLHLGSRAALDQALSRLVRRGTLMRAGRGVYVRPVETRFGVRAPSVEKVVEAIAGLRGETVVPHGAAAARAGPHDAGPRPHGLPDFRPQPPFETGRAGRGVETCARVAAHQSRPAGG
jgi:hypothetical protein